MRTPKNYTSEPMGSVLQKSEAETVARNIMVILSRTGDEWRPLSREEYEAERLKDGNYRSDELAYFDKVIGYCKSADTADLFCKGWHTESK